MYKIDSVEIDGFWHRFDAKCTFNSDVNIIIGRNGTGKTTFMNILHAVLTTDVSALAEIEFESAKVVLVKGKSKRTVQAHKVWDPSFPFPFVEYQISRKKARLRLISPEDGRMAISFKRRLQEQASGIREELDSLISVTSLSVYRLRNDDPESVTPLANMPVRWPHAPT